MQLIFQVRFNAFKSALAHSVCCGVNPVLANIITALSKSKNQTPTVIPVNRCAYLAFYLQSKSRRFTMLNRTYLLSQSKISQKSIDICSYICYNNNSEREVRAWNQKIG